MFAKVLIANRGAIACRIIRTLKDMGVGSVAVFSDADAGSLHVSQADEAVRIGPAPAAQSYLDIDAILAAAKATGAQAIHPGYGFLSENTVFAERCEAAGIAFIGPTPANILAFGLKHTARDLAQAQGVPLAPGTDLLTDAGAARTAAERIGFPVILKATAGGGGIGMRVCETPEAVAEAFAAVARLAGSNFSDAGVFLERYVRKARHIEVQVFGDGAGKVVALGERDCSLQRRNQKIIEECPSPFLTPELRARMGEASVNLIQNIGYQNAGTIEYLVDAAAENFYFMEMNTRIQVEHPVTEEVMGCELIKEQIRVAAGEPLSSHVLEATARGHSIECRINAEDPYNNFTPSPGTIELWYAPGGKGVRVDTHVYSGYTVPPHYDSMIAKLIVTGATREIAIARMKRALGEFMIRGIKTTIPFQQEIIAHPDFAAGTYDIGWVARYLEERKA